MRIHLAFEVALNYCIRVAHGAYSHMSGTDVNIDVLGTLDAFRQSDLQAEDSASLRPSELTRMPNFDPRLAHRRGLEIHERHAHEVHALVGVGEGLGVQRSILAHDAVWRCCIQLLVILHHHCLLLLRCHVVNSLLRKFCPLQGKLSGFLPALACFYGLLRHRHHGFPFRDDRGLIELCDHVRFPFELFLLRSMSVKLFLLFLCSVKFPGPLLVGRFPEPSFSKCIKCFLPLLQASVCLAKPEINLWPFWLQRRTFLCVGQCLVKLLELDIACRSIRVQLLIIWRVAERSSIVDSRIPPC
mmetsp:Transcript_10175/g.24430  ORF Transcript_10175/g.24430 Transcript_10175/m.24430 type:complete len:300 (-) Transcript_10175:600-1499(-)